MGWNGLVKRLYGMRRFGIEPGLERMKMGLEREGQPQQAFDVITVAGTNGKGSVASRLAAILQHQGHRVGLYTSPHLVDLRERFRVDGSVLPVETVEPVLESVLADHRRRSEQDRQGLTFFELTTMCAVVLFAQQEVDVAVFEVGLGGRLDAVNALEPEVSVITTIGRDHMEYLGDDMESIAREKAGVLREGVAAVVGAQEDEEAYGALLEAVRETKASPGLLADMASEETTLEQRHRWTARKAAEAWLGASVDEDALVQALERWRWPGRRDRWTTEAIELWVDAAHNPAGLESMLDWIASQDLKCEAVIWGGMADKEETGLKQVFESLGLPVWAVVLDNERSRDEAQLRAVVPQELWMGARGCEATVSQVVEEAEGPVLAFGSVYLLGELWAALGYGAEALRTYQGDGVAKGD